MGFMLDKKKVRAAARSMHQFCSPVRAFFPTEVDDATVEVCATYLYLRTAREVFGRAFSGRLEQCLQVSFKYSTALEIRDRVARIAEIVRVLEGESDELLPEGTSQSDFAHSLRCRMRGLLNEACMPTDDNELLRDRFVPFERLIERIEEHLTGIKRQNHFVMG